jgi:hypothetical protein
MKISKEEIFQCINKLKTNKVCGEDLVINEYIKSTANTFIFVFVNRFFITHKPVIRNNVRFENNIKKLLINFYKCICC